MYSNSRNVKPQHWLVIDEGPEDSWTEGSWILVPRPTFRGIAEIMVL